MFKNSLGFLLVTAFLISCNTEKKTEKAPETKIAATEIVAEINGQPISKEEFRTYFKNLDPIVQNSAKSEDGLKRILKDYVRIKTLAAEATKAGLDKDHKFRFAVDKLLSRSYIDKKFSEGDKKNVSAVTLKEKQDFYGKNIKEYVRPRMYRFAHLMRLDSKQLAPLLAGIKNNISQPEFAELVKKHSEDKDSKLRNGDLGYLSIDELANKFGDSVKDKVTALKNIGDLSEIVLQNEKGHIFQLRGIKPALSRTFKEVESQIGQLLYREKRRRNYDLFIEETLKRNKISYKMENLSPDEM